MAFASAVLIVLGLVIIVGAVVMTRRRASRRAVPVAAPVAAQPRADVAFDVGVPEAADDLADEVAIAEAVVLPSPSWPEQVHGANGTLDDEARLRLIGDLGMLRAAWCVPILERAAAEETNPDLHAAALAALAKCRRPGSTIAANGHVHAPSPSETE